MLHVLIYRSRSRFFADNDATNGGISREPEQLTLVNVEGPAEAA